MPKRSGYVKTFKVEEKIKKLMSFHIENEKLLEKYIDWRLKKYFESNSLPVYDEILKIKIRTYSDKVYTNFCGLNVPEDDTECESFTTISIEYLLVCENKYYL